jgi:hypothetical protein
MSLKVLLLPLEGLLMSLKVLLLMPPLVAVHLVVHQVVLLGHRMPLPPLKCPCHHVQVQLLFPVVHHTVHNHHLPHLQLLAVPPLVVQQVPRDDRQVLFLHVPLVLLLLPNVHPQMLVVPLMLSLLIKASATPLVPLVPPLMVVPSLL